MIGEDLGLKSFDLACEEPIWRMRNQFGGKSMVDLALEGEAEHWIGKGRDGRMKRRLIARIGLEEGIFFSYGALQSGEENSTRSIISLLTWLFSDDVDLLFTGLQVITILVAKAWMLGGALSPAPAEPWKRSRCRTHAKKQRRTTPSFQRSSYIFLTSSASRSSPFSRYVHSSLEDTDASSKMIRRPQQMKN